MESFAEWAKRDDGAFMALLAMKHWQDGMSRRLYVPKSKKQYSDYMSSLLDLLLKNTDARETFLAYGGECDIVLDPKTFRVKKVIAPYGARKEEGE